MPLAREVVEEVATAHGVCIRPVPVRRTDVHTGESTVVAVPCGATLTAKCPPCAERARALRKVQCRQGWHLDTEPLPDPDAADADQQALTALRADLTAERDRAHADADDGQVAELDAAIADVDDELTDSGVRGRLDPGRPGGRRARSTRRRQDAPDLPRLPVEKRTTGRTFTGRDGTVYRPSTFLTVTCDSYGRVNSDGTPVDPARYDYRRAARDALHFAKAVDRLLQNLRRAVGYDVQYFAAVEPQKRLAPHLHAALRGTIPRAVLRQVVAATYHQVWWPPCDTVTYDDDRLPLWDAESGQYVDPGTDRPLPTWDAALDTLGADEDAEPLHVVRFGPQLRADGVLGNTQDAGRCIGYLTKYLTKDLDACHPADTPAQRDHLDRMAAALRYEPCSPTCPNWLRYGVQPQHPRKGMTPGRCRGKAHQRATLGFGGRRVLVSRKWSGKNLADHRADRRRWVLATLGALTPAGAELSATTADPDRYLWDVVRPGDDDAPPRGRLILHALSERLRWQAELRAAQAAGDGTDPPPTDADRAA
jgi:hypothetical protein